MMTALKVVMDGYVFTVLKRSLKQAERTEHV